MKPLISLLLISSLVACSTTRYVESPIAPKPLVVGEELLQPCDDLPLIAILTFEDIKEAKIAETSAYRKCRTKHQSLADLIRKYLNEQ